MGPACTPMRVCARVSIVVDASGAPPPKGNGGGAMFGCYGDQHAQRRESRESPVPNQLGINWASWLQFPCRSHLNSNLQDSQSFWFFIFFKPAVVGMLAQGS